MKNVPKLRFNGFSDEWEEIRLGDYLVKSTEVATEHSNIPVLTSSRRGLFLQTEYFNKEISAKDTTGYNVIRKGYFTYRHMSDDSTFYFNINNKWDIALVSPEYPVFKTNEYLSQYILQQHLNSSKAFEKFCKMQKKGGTRTRLYYKVLQDYTMKIPSCEEQEKIANFLTKVDKLIEKQDEKVKNIEKYKKGMMQKIFSQEIRFKDENGEEYPGWNKEHLGNLVERVVRKNKGNISNRPLTISAQYGLVDQKEFFNKVVASSNLEGYYLLENGEFAYNKSYSNGYPFGAIKRLDKYDNGAVSTLYICFKPKNGLSSDFLCHYFESDMWHKEVAMVAVEGARNHGLLNISVGDFFDTLHKVPCKKEQIQIANFLNNISNLLYKEENKFKELQKWKKALLQQMFV